jgi:nucleotidyltransferase substrate binding protein (TIGR01987 family)
MAKALGEISFQPLEKALESLEKGIATKPSTDLERDGVIQRFEYTFELCWKSIRSLLLAMGRAEVSSSPKPLLRDALEENIIDDIKPWFAYLQARNHSTHTYNELNADDVYKLALQFPKAARQLLSQLKAKNESIK